MVDDINVNTYVRSCASNIIVKLRDKIACNEAESCCRPKKIDAWNKTREKISMIIHILYSSIINYRPNGISCDFCPIFGFLVRYLLIDFHAKCHFTLWIESENVNESVSFSLMVSGLLSCVLSNTLRMRRKAFCKHAIRILFVIKIRSNDFLSFILNRNAKR